jgi:hypothetical protein
MMGGAAALGSMTMLAATGPFLAGLGVGAALVGGALYARQEMRRRQSWRDDAAAAADSIMPDAGEARPAGTV